MFLTFLEGPPIKRGHCRIGSLETIAKRIERHELKKPVLFYWAKRHGDEDIQKHEYEGSSLNTKNHSLMNKIEKRYF